MDKMIESITNSNKASDRYIIRASEKRKGRAAALLNIFTFL